MAAAASDAEAVLHEVVRAAILLLNGDRGALFQLEKSGELSVLQRWPMVDVGIVDELPEEELAARALVREQPLIINPSLAVEDADAGERPSEPKAIAAVPVVRGGSSVAALVVLSFDNSIRFSDDDARVLTLLGQLVAPLLVDSTDRAQASLPDAADSRQTPTSFEPPPPADVDRLEREDETAQRVTRFDDGSSGGSQAEVRQIRRSQQEFLALISHQFRTPLTSIQGFSEMMVDEDLSLGELREYASDINRDAKRLDRILGEMIELASIESGQAGVEVESINLNSVVEEVADRARVAAPGRQLRLELDDTMALVAADRSHLSEVVARLIENAFEYTPDQGEIVLGSRANCEFAHVSVAHAGVGLTEDALGRLFDPFAEYDGDAAAYMGGIRLGLPIVSRLVALQGGEAWAERTIGEGAVFHFTMPLAPVLDGATDSME